MTGVLDYILTQLAEYEREKARAKLVDMGYEDCDVCRQARLRQAFRADTRSPREVYDYIDDTGRFPAEREERT